MAKSLIGGPGNPLNMTQRTQILAAQKDKKAKLPTRTVIVTQVPAPVSPAVPVPPTPVVIPDAAPNVLGVTTMTVLNSTGIPNAVDTEDPRVQVFGASGTNHSTGIVPDPSSTAGTTRALFEDGTWKVPAGGGSSDSLYTLTKPVIGSFIWVNQGTSIITATSLGFNSLFQSTNGAANSLAMRVQAISIAPYTCIIGFNYACLTNVIPSFGMVLRDSASGKLITWGVTASAGVMYPNCIEWTDETTYSGSIRGLDFPFAPGQQPCWFKIRDDATNLFFSFSCDGETWLDYATIGSSAYITADQIGFFVNNNDGSTDIAMTVVSWANMPDTPFSPLTMTGLEQWLDVSQIPGPPADNDKIGTWSDLSAFTHDVTQPTGALQPTYKTAQIGGLPVLRFTGTEYMQAATRVANLTDVTIFMVMRVAAGNAVGTCALGFGCSGAGSTGLWYYNSTSDWILVRAVGADMNGGGIQVQGTAYYNTVQIDNTLGGTLRVNGATAQTNAGATGYNGTVVENVGAAYTGNYQWKGDIAEIIVCNASLTTVERNQCEAYLAAKYGL